MMETERMQPPDWFRSALLSRPSSLGLRTPSFYSRTGSNTSAPGSIGIDSASPPGNDLSLFDTQQTLCRFCSDGDQSQSTSGSPVVGIGGASIQSNMQPQKSIFGLSSQLLFRSTDAFHCDSPLAQAPSPKKHGHTLDQSLLAPSFVSGDTHLSGRPLPLLTHRFCSSSGPVVPHSSPILMSLGEQEDQLGLARKSSSERKSFSARGLVESFKSHRFSSLPKAFGRRGGEEGRSFSKGLGGLFGNTSSEMKEAASCLPSQESCLPVSWSLTPSLQGSMERKSLASPTSHGGVGLPSFKKKASPHGSAGTGSPETPQGGYLQPPKTPKLCSSEPSEGVPPSRSGSSLLRTSTFSSKNFNGGMVPSFGRSSWRSSKGGAAPIPFAPTQWVEMFAGEDRAQVILPSSSGLTFVGVYDGFMDCAAVDFLTSQMYARVVEELELLGLPEGAPCQHQGAADPIHASVLTALERALDNTQALYRELADSMHEEQPELAVAGACVALAIVLGQHLYVLNIGDSAAVLLEDTSRQKEDVGAQGEEGEDCEFTVSFTDTFHVANGKPGPLDVGAIQINGAGEKGERQSFKATQLTVDHNTSNEQEVARVVAEHEDDPRAVDKQRLKSKLRVTRAFGGLFMKQAAMNCQLFTAFRINYVGTKPYLGSKCHLKHVPLSGFNGFLVLSSDGLYEYMKPQSLAQIAQATLAEGRLIEGNGQSQALAKALLDAALQQAIEKTSTNAGLLKAIPPGESRRKIHDDITLVVLQLGLAG